VATTRTTRADRATRLVVWCQRHPWVTSLAVALAVGTFAGPGIYNWCRHGTSAEVTTVFLLVPAGFAFLAHAGRGARSSWDRFAPWLAANVVATIAALEFCETGLWRVPWTSALEVSVPFAVWPLASAALLPGDPPADAAPAALVGYPAALVLFPPALAAAWRGEVWSDADFWAVGMVFCLAIAPLAFHAAVRSRAAPGRLVAVAVLLGFASSVLSSEGRTRAVFGRVDFWSETRPMSPLLPPAVWLAGALLAVAARRCRSMTAVPADHPVVADFGGR
jgi:hypothetical protein